MINLLAVPERAVAPRPAARSMPSWELTPRPLCDLEPLLPQQQLRLLRLQPRVDAQVIGGQAGGTGCRRHHQCGVRPHHAQKNDLNPWQHKHRVIQPQANAELVCAIEDVLEVYTRPDDSRRPHVCVDKASKQLVAETRLPIAAAPGQPECVDDAYERQGTAHLFMVFEPLARQRRVKVTERRTAVDFAQLIRVRWSMSSTRRLRRSCWSWTI